MFVAAVAPFAEIIGTLAAVLTSAAFLPQVWKTVRSGHADDFSWGWLAAFGAGIALWAGYGVLIGSWPMVINNVFVWACVVIMAWVKLRATP